VHPVGAGSSMWKSLLAFLDQYHGLIIGFAVLAAVLFLNQLI
jgi:hypothetical protein